MDATNDGGSEWQPQRGERHRPPVQRTGASLERQALEGRAWTTSETFDDGPALFAAVCKLGLEGVVAKNATSRYRPNERGWVKIKNEAMTRKHERRAQLQR